VREKIEYRFRVLSAVVFTLYSYSKALEYRFRVPIAGSLMTKNIQKDATSVIAFSINRLVASHTKKKISLEGFFKTRIYIDNNVLEKVQVFLYIYFFIFLEINIFFKVLEVFHEL
jgi:hypothetical protein